MTPVRRGGLGTGERVVRGVLGGGAAIAGLAGWLSVGGWFAWAWFAIGLIGIAFFVTAARGYCPLCARLGLGQPYTVACSGVIAAGVLVDTGNPSAWVSRSAGTRAGLPAGGAVDSAAQRSVTRRYQRIAALYDLFSGSMERAGMLARRERVVGRASGDTLEVGIGTGRNLVLYQAGVRLVATDVAPRMLERAQRRAAAAAVPVHLEQADVQQLPYPDGSFDTAVATCVFCSVPDPVAGLRELRRVVRPEGRVLLLEHVRPRNAILGRVADALSPVTAALLGPHLNRRTEESVRAAGLRIVEVRAEGIWREITAQP